MIYKVKKNSIYLCLILGFMLILFGLNRYNVDMINYQNLYYRVQDGAWVWHVEQGFMLSLLIATKLNMNYFQFLFVYSSIGLVVLIKGLGYFTKNVYLSLCCYCLFPFLLDIIQIRNFMAMSISIYAMHYLLEKNVRNKIGYIIWIIIASSFHFSALSYLIFLLIALQDYTIMNLVKRIIYILAFTVFLFQERIVEILSPLFPRLAQYSERGTALATKFEFAFYFIGVNFIFYYVKRYISCTDYTIEEKRNKELIYNIAISANIFLPVMMYSVEMFRIYRNMFPLFYVYWSDYCWVNKKVHPSGLLLVFSFIALSFYAFIGMHTMDTVVYDIFSNNAFMEIFKIIR